MHYQNICLKLVSTLSTIQNCTKKGIIKGFADRARALCDDQHLGDELQNVEDVFVANGYDRKMVIISNI